MHTNIDKAICLPLAFLPTIGSGDASSLGFGTGSAGLGAFLRCLHGDRSYWVRVGDVKDGIRG